MAAPDAAGAEWGDVASALLARRILVVHGMLDDSSASRLAASAMMLDASGDERIVMRLTSAVASLDIGLMLCDVLAVLGVPVDTVGAGTIAGGAVALLASGRMRLLAPHARLHLREPDTSVAGRAIDIERAFAADTVRRERFFDVLSARTHRPVADIAREWAASPILESTDAVTLGYADGVDAPATNVAPG